MKLSGLLRQLAYLRSSVNSCYGKGFKNWVTFIYYSLLRKNRFRILRFDLQHKEISVGELPGVTFITPALEEIDALRSADSLPREFFCDRFHKVSNCIMGRVNGEIAYIHWVYFKGDFSRFLKIGEDSAEINYVITLPAYRGRGISAAAFLHSLRELKEKGKRKVFAVVHEENVASIKSFCRAGFEDAGSTYSFGLLNRKVDV